MFDFIAKGGSCGELSRWLAKRGIYSPGIRLRSGLVEGAPGEPFSPNTLRYLLMNYMFAGEYCYNRYWPQGPGNTSGRRFRPREYWHIVENYCEPTVSRETFFKVQAILENGVRPVLKHSALLTGVLYCGLCGSKMTVVTSRSSSSYRCSGKKNHTTGCTAAEATAKSLDGLVERLLLEHYFTPEYVAPFCESSGINSEHAAAKNGLVKELEARRAQLDDELAEVKAIPQISLSLRAEMVRTLENERASVEAALRMAGTPEESGGIDFGELSSSLREWWGEADFRARRAFIRASFQRLVFTRATRHVTGELRVHSRLPALAALTAPIAISAAG
jgi:hypothetical protein